MWVVHFKTRIRILTSSKTIRAHHLIQLCSFAMDERKSGRRSRTLSFGIPHGARLRRRSEDSTTATRINEDDSDIKKLQEMLQQSLRREADTLKKLRHLSEMYQELLYRSHSPAMESKWGYADRCKYMLFLQFGYIHISASFFARVAFRPYSYTTCETRSPMQIHLTR